MGQNSSSSFVSVPDTEYTPCAVLLKKLGYRLVIFGFENVMIPERKEINNHTVVRYTESACMEKVHIIRNHIPDHVSGLVVSLLSQGVTVSIITEHTSDKNGEVIVTPDQTSACYAYQGIPLITKIIEAQFGEEVAQFIHVSEGKKLENTIRGLLKTYHLPAQEVLLIHATPSLIRYAKQHHMGTILVEDHTFGLTLS